MGGESEIYAELDKSFRAACKVLFWQEIGGLKECSSLFSYARAPKKERSMISGKDIYVCAPYWEKSRFISLDEKSLLPAPKFSPNDIKDVDSLLRAARENASYCGNKIIGNSGHCARCDNVTDSFFVYASHNVTKSEHIAYSELVIKSKHLFGSSAVGESEFCMGLSEGSLAKRAFESAQVQTCSDIYCCFFTRNCKECMFSFGQHSKMFMVGNNQLGRKEYVLLKKELISQMALMLKSKKRGLLLSDIVGVV